MIKSQIPKSDKPKSQIPKSDNPKSQIPKSDKPQSQIPKSDKPKSDNPKSDNPKSDNPKSDKPKSDNPKSDKSQIQILKSQTSQSQIPESKTPNITNIDLTNMFKKSMNPGITDCPPCDKGTTGRYIYSVFHSIMGLVAIYLAYRCNKGFSFGPFLVACTCPYIYVTYVVATQGTCGVFEK